LANDVTFHVTVGAGTPPYSYQWQSNGVNIVNGTNSFLTASNISGAAFTDSYRVIVTNAVGSVTSAGAAIGPNHFPVANADTINRPGILPLQIDIASLLANDTDIDAEPVQLAGVTLTTTAGVTLATNAYYIFYTNWNFVDDQFQYAITDAHAGTLAFAR
jgi:hypothetical protein